VSDAKPNISEIFEAKRREIDAAGLCQWSYNWPAPTGCIWCDKGHEPIQSSVSDKMVHTGMRTIEDRVICTRKPRP
jgi:hypothetical protein